MENNPNLTSKLHTLHASAIDVQHLALRAASPRRPPRGGGVPAEPRQAVVAATGARRHAQRPKLTVFQHLAGRQRLVKQGSDNLFGPLPHRAGRCRCETGPAVNRAASSTPPPNHSTYRYS